MTRSFLPARITSKNRWRWPRTAVLGRGPPLPELDLARPGIEIGDEHGENAGEKNTVEGAGAADRSDRRAEPADLVEIGQIGADQRAEAAGDISEWRSVAARQQKRDGGRSHV